MVCPKCKGTMRVISSIEDPSVIRAILEHLVLWLARARPPKTHSLPVCLIGTGQPTVPHITDDVCCQLPTNDEHLYREPEYSWDEYIRA